MGDTSKKEIRYTTEMKLLVIGLLVILNLGLLIKIHFWQYVIGATPLWDFDIYYQIVRDALTGLNIYQLPYMQTSGPPLVVVPYLLVSWLPLAAARSLMNAMSLIAGLGTSWLLANKILASHSFKSKVTVTLVLNALLLMTFPARFNFITGQPNLIAMFLTTVVVVTFDQKIQGLAAGLLAIIKTNYLLIFASFFKHQRGSIVVGIVTLVVGLILSLSLFNPISSVEFLTNRGPSFVNSIPQTTDVDYYNQSLRATTARLRLGSLYPWLFIGFGLIAVIYLIRTGDVISSIIISLLIAPVLWQHYIVVVYPILVLMAVQDWRNRKISRWFVLASVLLLTHLPGLHGHPAIFPYNLLASHYFLGLGILLAYQVRRGRIVA